MLYWECKRRLDLLREFRCLGADYFTNLQPRDWGEPPAENEIARKARYEMNRLLGAVAESMDALGLSRTVYYTPPRLLGGPAGPMDLLANLFQLWRFGLEPRIAADLLDRAIGEYERETARLLRQCFNPFFWLKWLLSQLLGIPFRVLEAVGFRTATFERSFFGRLIKATFALAAFGAAVVTIADRYPLLHSVWIRLVQAR